MKKELYIMFSSNSTGLWNKEGDEISVSEIRNLGINKDIIETLEILSAWAFDAGDLLDETKFDNFALNVSNRIKRILPTWEIYYLSESEHAYIKI